MGVLVGRFGWKGWRGVGLRRGGAQAEAAGATCYDGDLAFEGEEGGEVVELCFGHGEEDWRVLRRGG